jgi:hypothetical protein
MTISDPAQLLQRIPELEVVADYPNIKRAIESGDPFKVYRALVWAKLLGRIPQHRDTLKLLVKQRRLFAKPFKHTPSLGTINSLGFGFVGESERDTDGSHIALHALVVLFAIPVVPLGSYLVMSTGSRQWRIYARVPMGIFGWLYSRGLALMLILSILGGAASSFHKSQTQDVTVLNGFAIPLDVVLDGERMTVPAQGRSIFNVGTGTVKGNATSAKYGVIDTFSQTVNSHGGYTIWNIAGATPLIREDVSYYKTVPANAADPAPTIYCGQRYIETGHIDFAFTEPAKTLSMGKYDTVVTRSHLDIVQRKDSIPANLCTSYLFSVNKTDQAGPLFEVQALLSDWDDGLTRAAAMFASSVSPAEGVRIAKRAITAKPDNVDLHRLYQTVSDEAGQFDGLLRDYTERANREPESASAQYLHAVLLKGPEGLAKIEQLATKFDKDPYILRSLTWRRVAAGNYAGAADSYDRLKKVSPAMAADSLDDEIAALVGQAHLQQALNVISESYHGGTDHDPVRNVGDFALISSLSGNDPAGLLNEYFKTEQNADVVDMVLVRIGRMPQQQAAKRSKAVNLALALRSDPAQALKLADTLNRSELFALQMEQAALLYCEAARVGDKVVMDRMRLKLTMSRSDLNTMEKFVKGEAITLDAILMPPSIQAAASFIRSRNASLPETERSALRQHAARTDLFHTVITLALQQWPT